MRIFVGVVTSDRARVLELTLRFLHLDITPEVRSATEVYVFDTSQDASNNLETMRLVTDSIRPLAYIQLSPPAHGGGVDACNAELGLARRALVTEFMKHPEFTHCVILDDDILVSLKTIYDAVGHLHALRGMGIASLTLHPYPKRLGMVRYMLGDHVFVNHDFSGDHSWILPRSTIEKFGVEMFGRHPGGYANNMWAAIQSDGQTNVTRLHPCYEVQHIGIESLVGSKIYRYADKKPAWTKRLFQDYVTKRTLHSEVAMLLSSKGLEGLINYMRKETSMIKGNDSVGLDRNSDEIAEKMPMPKGKVEIELADLKTGKSELVHVENLVVDNAKKIMARLLGGSDVDDWSISRMLFGTGSTTPTETDVSLEIPFTPEKSVTIDYPDDSSVRFTGVLESDEANGFPVAEAALYSGSEGIFSRVVFGPLSKSADFRFVFRWTIYW